MNTNSVSKLFLILEIKDKFKIKCQLKRHFDPTLVGRINRSLPLSGNSHMLEKNAIYFGTSIEAGSQRIKKEFKKVHIFKQKTVLCIYIFEQKKRNICTKNRFFVQTYVQRTGLDLGTVSRVTTRDPISVPRSQPDLHTH